MIIKRTKNFLTKEELVALNSWAEIAVKNKWLDLGIQGEDNKYSLRLTSRLYGNRFYYDQDILNIRDRVFNHVGVLGEELVHHHGRDGIVVSYTQPGGSVYSHRDPRVDPNKMVLRCNIVTQMQESGGELFIEEQPCHIEHNELHCYFVSEVTHRVTAIEGRYPRILWMFGVQIPENSYKL